MFEEFRERQQAANIDQSPPRDMSLKEIEDLKQHYLDEMKSLSNDLQIKDYRNEKIYIRFRRECEDMIAELKKNSSNAIAPVLPIEEPDNSLSMGDEHLSTILETESDEVTKSSVEDLVPILSESEGISNDTCDVPFCDNSPPLDVLNDHFEIFSNFNNDCTSSDDDSFEDVDYIEESPPDSELVSLEEVKDDILHEKLLNINFLITCDLPSSDDFSPITSFTINDRSYCDALVVYCDGPVVYTPCDELDCPDFEDSHARGFVHRPLDL
ncbi:hypothetical protein Tco_0490471 [Tanacetum coccineum]